MDTFPFDSWEEAIADGGAFFTWAGSQGMINLLTVLGVAAFLVSLIYIIRNEDNHLNSAAARLGEPAGAAALLGELAGAEGGE